MKGRLPFLTWGLGFGVEGLGFGTCKTNGNSRTMLMGVV